MKYLLFSICLLFIFSSCKNSGADRLASSISATVDGADVKFNSYPLAHIITNAIGTTGIILSINGATDTSGNRA